MNDSFVKKSRRRRNKNNGQPAFQPPAAPYFDPNQRSAMPSMAPPRHLPTNIVAPMSVDLSRQQQNKAKTAPAVALNTFKLPSQKQFNMQPSLGAGAPPPPPPSKPIMNSPGEMPVVTKPVVKRNRPPMFNIPSMAPPKHLPTNIKPPSDSIVLPRSPPQNSFAPAPPPGKSVYNNSPPPRVPSSKSPNNPNMAFLLPPPGDRTGLPNPDRAVSQLSAGSRRKKRKKKKRLNKFHSAEIKREPEPVFVPKPAPKQPIPLKPAAISKKRGNSKNISEAFYGAALGEPNDMRFDRAMEKMKMKMERQKTNQEIFTEPKVAPRSREKSRQLQSKLTTQFGFFQNKFNHKEKTPSRRRRGANRKGQPVPTLPPRKQNTQQGSAGGMSNWF